jgi:hypothetical protein
MSEMNRWCLGLKFAGTRSLTPVEVDRFTLELRRIEKRSKRQLYLFAAVAILGVTASVLFMMDQRGAGDVDPTRIFFSVVAICLCAAGLAGSISEILFGSRFRRILFAAALAGLFISSTLSGPFSEALGSLSAIIGVIGGNVMLVHQMRDRRRISQLVRNLRKDLAEGNAWHFEREFPAGNEGASLVRHTADVLPASMLGLAVDDKTLQGLTRLDVTSVAAGGTGSMDAPLRAFEPGVGSERFDLRQRQLTLEEKTELGRLVRRDLRVLLTRAVIVFWAATIFASNIDAMSNNHPNALSAKSLLTGAVLVAAFLAWRWRPLQRIRVDLRQGLVIVIRPKDAAAEDITVEKLPRSNVIWSEFGAPSKWRVK